MVKRGNAKENVLTGLAVVLLLHTAGVQECAVRVQNGLGEARSAR